MGGSKWGVSVGAGPLRVYGPAPTWGLRLGLLAGFLIVTLLWGLGHCEAYQVPVEPSPTPIATYVP